jgi:hypothetical protein
MGCSNAECNVDRQVCMHHWILCHLYNDGLNQTYVIKSIMLSTSTHLNSLIYMRGCDEIFTWHVNSQVELRNDRSLVSVMFAGCFIDVIF